MIGNTVGRTLVVLAGLSLGATALPVASLAQQKELTVLGLDVHRDNMRAMGKWQGGVDNLADFEAQNDAKVTYVSGTTTSLQESLARLGSLDKTKEDVIYVNMLDANSRLTSYLAPLDDALAPGAVAGFPDQWSPSVVASAKFNDHLYLLPVRCGTFTLWYDDRIFAERGISGPPKTPEELYEIAKKGTFTQPNGEQVYGFSTRGDKWSLTEDATVMARMFGGDLITQDFKVVINQPPAVAAIKLLQRMYKEGIMPPNWATIDGSAQAEMFRSERLSMVIGGANYDGQYNTPDAKINGHAVPAHLPLLSELQTPQKPFSESVIWYWGIGILHGATDKELAQKFVQRVASADVQKELAANGNGPCTVGVLSDMAKTSPGMKLAAEIFPVSRPTIPAHPNMNQVRDIMGEAIQNIVVNGLDAQTELDNVARQMQRLLK
jgi:multiple sugar transport system substrate-binding protein